MGRIKVIRNELSLPEFKEKIKTELNVKVNEAIVVGFQSEVVLKSTNSTHFYATNEHDQRNFMGKHAILMQDPTIVDVYWKTEDTGSFILHTRDEIFQICKEVMHHIEGLVAANVFVKQAIDEATTHEEVLAIASKAAL